MATPTKTKKVTTTNTGASCPCNHCGYIFDRGQIVTYWRNETALFLAGLHTAYLCGKCATAKAIA